ncbi:hypothetical protein RFI_39945, partial [Reticulomyxa filosa]
MKTNEKDKNQENDSLVTSAKIEEAKDNAIDVEKDETKNEADITDNGVNSHANANEKKTETETEKEYLQHHSNESQTTHVQHNLGKQEPEREEVKKACHDSETSGHVEN